MMRRRHFFTLLGGAAAAWPLAARAQQTMPVIGFLGSGSQESDAIRVNSFRRGLSETGFVEGRSVVLEYRFAEGQHGRLPALAADLVRHRAAVIITGSTPGALAAKAADHHDPDCLLLGSGPGRGRTHREPEPTGWATHGRYQFGRNAGTETT